MPLRADVYQSVDHRAFHGLAQRYHHYWSEDPRHLEHDDHLKIRIALGKVLLHQKIRDVVAFCGTGPEIANQRDLDSTLLGVFLEDCPVPVFSDFSSETSRETWHSVLRVSRTVADRAKLVVRDFSRNHFSARFDALLRDRIQAIESASGMHDFITYLRNEVGTDAEGIEKINQRPLPSDHGLIDPYGAWKTDTQQGLQFDKILDTPRPIRLVVANLLVTGMYAVTEMDFRRKLHELRLRGQLPDERVVEYLSVWHTLILALNHKAGREFIEDALHANDNIDEGITPIVFLSADDTVTYRGLEGFPRIDMDAIRDCLPASVRMRQVECLIWDHSHEEFPHTHTVRVCVLEPIEEMAGSEPPAPADVGAVRIPN